MSNQEIKSQNIKGQNIKGKWHAAGSAACSPAILSCQHDRYTLNTECGQSLYGMLTDLEISPRLGNIERKITLKGGSLFTTADNESIDRLLKFHKKSSNFIHHIESKLSWVIVAFCVTLFTGFGFFKWGIPWASMQIAHMLPNKTNELIASNSLVFLDKHFFDESQLEPQRQEAIRAHFETMLLPLEHDKDISYTLHFREWESGGVSIPNAFALPSGDIILTDKFVELSQTQSEMDSVLLHEMGHVTHRHTLQMIISSTFITAIIVTVTGDASALADIGLGLGSLMVSSNYSRGHESEADEYAFKKMLHAKIDPANFASIMERMTRYMEAEMANDDEGNDTETAHKNNRNLLDYISSHPKTEKRIAEAQRYSNCFKEGLLECKH